MDATRKSRLRRSLLAAAITGALCVAGAARAGTSDMSSYAASAAPPTFDSAESALAEFRKSLDEDNIADLAKLLGLDIGRLAANEGSAETFARMREGAKRQLVVEDLGDRKIVEIGDVLWPMPFPLVMSNGRWSFDRTAGLEEIVNRRIGENELTAIATLRAYVDAQQEYFAQDRNGDGVLEYAQKLISSSGKTDGLDWPADQGDGDSPAGGFANEGEVAAAQRDEGYFGYRFRVLTKQGADIAGGAHSYLINGHMIAGFALLAWPVRYSETGVQSFEINQRGIVYEVDLGPQTDRIARGITTFNPDGAWDVVAD